MKYKTRFCEGYWADEPERIFTVKIALGEWDGIEDEEDDSIFYYMNNEELNLGTNLSEGFVITEIEILESENDN